MEHVLVTGGAGFIGSHFVKRILAADDVATVAVVDALTYAGHIENLGTAFLSPKLTFVHGNILDAELVDSLMDKHTAVVHFAAESHVDRSFFAAAAFLETNVRGTQTRRHGDPCRRPSELPVRQTEPHGLFVQHQRALAHAGSEPGRYGDVPARREDDIRPEARHDLAGLGDTERHTCHVSHVCRADHLERVCGPPDLARHYRREGDALGRGDTGLQPVRRADPEDIEHAAVGRQPGLQRPDRGERGVGVTASTSPVTMRRKLLGRREDSFTPRSLLARPPPRGRFEPCATGGGYAPASRQRASPWCGAVAV